MDKVTVTGDVKDEKLLWVRSAVITVTNVQVTKTWTINFGKETEL